MITLKANDYVRAEAWRSCAYVGTVEDYAISYGEDPQVAIDRAVGFGHNLAYTILPPAVLVGDRTLGAKLAAEARANHAAAVVLKTGDEVEIRGRRYTVRFAARQEKCEFPGVSDPIHFVPVEG